MKAGKQDSRSSLLASEIAAHHSNKINNPTFMSFTSYSGVSLFYDHLGFAGLGCVLWQQRKQLK